MQSGVWEIKMKSKVDSRVRQKSDENEQNKAEEREGEEKCKWKTKRKLKTVNENAVCSVFAILFYALGT